MVILIPAMLIVAGFAVNLSYMEMARTDMQIASDAASRAACRTYARTGDRAAAIASARATAAANRIAGKVYSLSAGDIQFGTSIRPDLSSKYTFTPGGRPHNAVRVTFNPRATQFLRLPMAIGTNGRNFRPSQNAIATQAELDISLVVDRSGSMAFGSDEVTDPNNPPKRAPVGWQWGDPVPPGSRWLEAVEAVGAFLSILDASPANEQVGLITYTENAFSDVAMTDDYSAIGGTLANYCNSFGHGATNIGDGIGFGVNNLIASPNSRKWAVRVMIVLTDGIHNWGPEPVGMTYYAKENNVIVHTVTFSKEADQGRMQQVAEVGSGKHYHATNIATLRAAFQEIARNLPVLLTE